MTEQNPAKGAGPGAPSIAPHEVAGTRCTDAHRDAKPAIPLRKASYTPSANSVTAVQNTTLRGGRSLLYSLCFSKVSQLSVCFLSKNRNQFSNQKESVFERFQRV